MVARIAPSPLSNAVAVGDAYAHARGTNDYRSSTPAPAAGAEFVASNETTVAINPAPPAAPPGEAFAAAVIAGQLPPVPVTPEDLRQRLGSAWQPPASPLRLMDRSA